jgi:UDP-glucose 4-epimerase
MSKVLVTGGAGFVGSHLVDALLARGNRVRVLDNLSTGRRTNLAHVEDQIEFVEGDITNPETVRGAVVGVEVVYHQAALASVPRSVAQPLATHAACATGTVELLHAAARANVRRLVYASSSSVYGNQAAPSKQESQLPSPLSPYAAAKLSAENYCQAFAATFPVETVSLRYFNVFGPRQDPDGPYAAVIPRFVRALLSGNPPTIYGDGRQSRDFTYVENVVEANLRAGEAPNVSGRVFNVACGQSISLLELLQHLQDMLGTDIAPDFAAPRAGDVRDSLADISQAKQFLGYRVKVDFVEGLRQTLDYYRTLP